MIKLSERLKAIAEMVPESITADIGSDHGKLMIYLFETGKISYGYAVENKRGPYNNLVKNLKENKLIDYIIPLYSDGLDDLPDCVKTIVIAGMGGENIIAILKKHPEKVKHIETIIIDAHSLVPEVREEISKMGFVIADEKIIKEANIFYEIIKFIRAEIATYGENDLQYGPILRKEKGVLFIEKYQKRIKVIERLMKKDIPSVQIEKLRKEKEGIENILR